MPSPPPRSPNVKYFSQLHPIQLDRNLCRPLGPDCRWLPKSQLVMSELCHISKIILWLIQTVKSWRTVIKRLSVRQNTAFENRLHEQKCMLPVSSTGCPVETDGISCLERDEGKVGSCGCLALEQRNKSC